MNEDEDLPSIFDLKGIAPDLTNLSSEEFISIHRQISEQEALIGELVAQLEEAHSYLLNNISGRNRLLLRMELALAKARARIGK